MSFQAAEPTAHSNHTNWSGMAQGTLKAEMSKIRPGDQNQPDKESSLVHWTTLQIVKEGLNFWGFKCILISFPAFSDEVLPFISHLIISLPYFSIGKNNPLKRKQEVPL